jgi:outer membrane protein OmpA-like peptidoglycan-associated protein/tetratricopeptide (TPR) repeat protein
MYEMNYDEALSILLRMDEIDPNNPNVWYKIGVCYLNTRIYKSRAESYLEKAVDYINPDYTADNHRVRSTPLETLLYLGQAYRLNYKFQESLDAFNELISRLDPQKTEDAALIADAEREIDITKNAIYHIDNPVDATLENLGATINTKYTEHSPIIDLNEDMLIFTSRRPRENEAAINSDEDIFVSRKVNNEWQNPVRLSSPINTEIHNEAAIALSTDGKQLFFFRSGYNNTGNVYVTERLDEQGYQWSQPKLIREDMNTKYRETHVCLSPDGHSLFFTSNRKGGEGQRDIYVMRKLPDGEWSAPKNIGKSINTPYNEESPYIHPDGVTMFFSSEGHNAMGGYDVFQTTMDKQGNFTEPVNLGYPINTPDDNVAYIMNMDGRRGYIASARDGGYGDLDIYVIIQDGIYYNNLIVYEGIVSDINNNIPNDLVIAVKDVNTSEQLGVYRPNNSDGKYLLVLFPDREYKISYEASGHITKTIDYIPTDENMRNFSTDFMPIEFLPVLLQEYLLHDFVYFNDDETELDAEAVGVLNKVINKINEVKDDEVNLIININTPLIGSDTVKYIKRSEAIIEYLVNNNISKASIYVDGTYPDGYSEVYALDMREIRTEIAISNVPVVDEIEYNTEDTTVIENILFSFDKSNIKPEYFNNLNRLAEYLQNNPNAQIEVAGHTDALGSSEYNYLLSYRRAKSVKDYLVEKGSNPANIITAKYGKDQPIASNIGSDGRDNPAGRRYNRRAEFSVIAQGVESYLIIKDLIIDEPNHTSNISGNDKWTIQISAIRKMKPVDFFADLVGVKMHLSEDGWYRYYIGEFNSRREARQALNSLKQMGYEPFIRKLDFFETQE